MLVLPCSRNLDGKSDIVTLRGLVAATEKNGNGLAVSNEVNAIARSIVDAQFADARSDWPDVSRISKAQPENAGINPGSGANVPKKM